MPKPHSTLGLTLCALLIACEGSAPNGGGNGNNGDTSGGMNNPFIDGRHCDEESGVTWESFAQGFMLDHCAGCHSETLVEGMRAGAPPQRQPRDPSPHAGVARSRVRACRRRQRHHAAGGQRPGIRTRPARGLAGLWRPLSRGSVDERASARLDDRR